MQALHTYTVHHVYLSCVLCVAVLPDEVLQGRELWTCSVRAAMMACQEHDSSLFLVDYLYVGVTRDA